MTLYIIIESFLPLFNKIDQVIWTYVFHGSFASVTIMSRQTRGEKEVEASTLEEFTTAKLLEAETNSISKQAFKPEAAPSFLKKSMKFDYHKIEQESDCMDGYELEEYFLYAFASNQINSSLITLYSFAKDDGSQNKILFKELNGAVTCLKIIVYIQTAQSNAISKSHLKLLIGTNDGFVKVLNLQEPFSLAQIKLDVKPVTMMLEGDYTHFSQHNVCIALTSDSQIYFIDLQHNQIAFVLKPIIAMCDSALSITINDQYTHLLQSTTGGYIIFWKMDKVKENFRLRKESAAYHKERVYNVFPMCCDHSVAIEGLIWCQFYGHLIVLITREGFLRVVSLIFGTEHEYIDLLTFKIESPESISSVQLFSGQDLIVLSKNTEKFRCMELYRLSPQLKISEFRTIYIEGIDPLQDFYLTDQFNILLCRTKSHFVINQCPEILEAEQHSSNSY